MKNTIKSNWGRNIIFKHNSIAYPKTEEEIQNLVVRAADEKLKVRVIGNGHSFSNLCQTDQLLISLENYQGIISINRQNDQVTVKAGTKLKLLGELLFQEGLAMENLGDIDSQSIAGTISTGTHGTGISFGTISTQVVKIKFINGKGEVITCSESQNRDLFKATQVSLGVIGIITEITIQCVQSYKLLIQNRKESLDKVLSSIHERNCQNRNFEYYWVPYTNTTWTKSTSLIYDKEPDKYTFVNYLSELLLENYSFKGLCEFARIFPSKNKTVAKITAQSLPTIDKINHSHKVYATMRLVRFTEMEYNIPAEAYQDVMKEITRSVNSGKYNIHFPIENRWVKGDDIFLSPAYGRDSAYIACHVYHKKENKKYFNKLESIFQAHGGRPHWGKLNTFTTKDVENTYPEFNTFTKYRKEHDPEDIFLNPYLKNQIT